VSRLATCNLLVNVCTYKKWFLLFSAHENADTAVLMAFPRFVTDNSMDDTGFFLTWAEVPGTPGCGGLLTQVTFRALELFSQVNKGRAPYTGY
jgi:hypothetical protein